MVVLVIHTGNVTARAVHIGLFGLLFDQKSRETQQLGLSVSSEDNGMYVQKNGLTATKCCAAGLQIFTA